MIIERFFGKGRAGQPETQPPRPRLQPRPRPRAEEVAGPERGRAEAPAPPDTGGRRGGDAAAERADKGTGLQGPLRRTRGGGAHERLAKAGALAPPSYEEIAARATISGWRRDGPKDAITRTGPKPSGSSVPSGPGADPVHAPQPAAGARTSAEGDRLEPAGDGLHVGAGRPRAVE